MKLGIDPDVSVPESEINSQMDNNNNSNNNSSNMIRKREVTCHYCGGFDHCDSECPHHVDEDNGSSTDSDFDL